MYDLTCIVPLYGKNCEDVSLRMVSSLALQKTRFSVKYLFYYDDTVSIHTLTQIDNLFGRRGKDYSAVYSNKTCSGHKRNLGLRFAEANSTYVWLLDQDDYLLRDDVIELILQYLNGTNGEVFKVTFTVPDSIDEGNNQIIHSIPTMPWQYVVRTDLISGYAFNEENEYGSDVPFSIRFLVMHDYMKVNEDLSVTFKKILPAFKNSIYLYNYLNPNSYMSSHLTMKEEPKHSEMDYAYGEIRKVKEEKERQEQNENH